MSNAAEEKVSTFYNTIGWESDDGVTEDARRWEDLRDCAREYVSKCRLRLLDHIPPQGDFILDMASGPIQYPEYLKYSEGYKKRYCVDLSSGALAKAKERIGDHGEFLCGSIFDLPIEEKFFDCVISLHTIYHIDKDRQADVVRKLIGAVKPGKPVVILYSNPDTFMVKARRWWKRVRSRSKKSRAAAKARREATAAAAAAAAAGQVATKDTPDEAVLYFFCHPLSWWDQFSDQCEVRILSWRALTATAQKAFVPDNAFGKAFLKLLFRLEDQFPEFFAWNFQYPMIVLTRHSEKAGA